MTADAPYQHAGQPKMGDRCSFVLLHAEDVVEGGNQSGGLLPGQAVEDLLAVPPV